MTKHAHATDDALELYSLGRLEEPELAAVEEHLLVCPQCQARLEQEDEFTQAARAALERVPAVRPQPEAATTGWFAWPRFAWAGALAVAAFVAFMILAPNPEAQPVTLLARRDAALNSQAAPGRPLLLRIPLAEVASAASYRLEIAAASGQVMWSGTPAPEADFLQASTPALEPGSYWVRLYTGETILNEFALNVR